MPIVRALHRAAYVPRLYYYPCIYNKGAALSQGQVRWNVSAAAAEQKADVNTHANETAAIENGDSESFDYSPKLKQLLDESKLRKGRDLSRDISKLASTVRYMAIGQAKLRSSLAGDLRIRSSYDIPQQKRDLEVKEAQGKPTVMVSKKKVPNIWLRDNCQCSQCLHSDTKQRLLDTFSIPNNIAIKAHTLDENALTIEWSDGHQSVYTRELLHERTKPEIRKILKRNGAERVQFWDCSIAPEPPRVSYESITDSVQGILERIRSHGFCYVDETPATPEATEELLRSIAFIRETHYGGFYDFTADLASKDTAYTNIALEAHTDTTYFSEPAGLQAFHLLSHTDGSGGASLLVDGFNAAKHLLAKDPKAYQVLAKVNVFAHASGNKGISIQPYRGFPVFEHDPTTGDLLRVRWNTSDRADIQLPYYEVEMWYDAARKFDSILKNKQNEYWEQLTPGRVLIFDNWRVLHGRSEFTGKRRICGGYINRDDWISKHKMLKYGEAMIL